MRFSFVIILSGCIFLQAQAYPGTSKDCQNKHYMVHSYCLGNLNTLLQLVCAFMRDLQANNVTHENTMHRYNETVAKPRSGPFLDTKLCCQRGCTISELHEYCREDGIYTRHYNIIVKFNNSTNSEADNNKIL